MVRIEEVSVEDGSIPLTAGHALKQHAYGGLTLRRLAPAARPVRRGGDDNLCLSYGDPPSYSHVDGTYLSKEEVVLLLRAMTSVNVADADDAISVKRHFGLTEKRIRWLMRIAEGTGEAPTLSTHNTLGRVTSTSDSGP